MVKIRIPKLENSIKLYLVGLVILNIILRIPRVGGIIGDDAFRVIWMGKVLSEGYTDLWTVSIFSFFGLYPFSFYPIGVPFILAGLFTIGLSYEVAVFLLSIVTCVIGAIGSYYLGEELLHSQEKGLIFSLLYSISPIFLRVSYYTITVRGPFMGVLPWFLLYSWKLYQNRERKYILHVVVLLILLAMIHRLAILMVFYVIPLVGVALLPAVVSVPKRIIQKISVFSKFRLPFTDKVQNIESSLRKHGILGNMGIFPLAITLLLLAGTYLIALLLIPIDPQKTVEVFLSNSTTLGVTVNLIIDYGLRLGIVC
ncbi:MAG: 6-pyruvoyl-tetrahydropterin synthase-related protein, partial [Candidatus Thorarchaeota archaeon]